MQRIEGVEELLLGALFLRQELNVVHQQHVHIAELIAEADHLVIAQRVDHLVSKFLAGEIANGGLRLAALYLMSNGLHQVGLAHSNAAVEEQRVVGLGGTLCYRLGGSVRELIAGADHESLEGVAGIQQRSAIPIKARLGLPRC